MQVRNLAATTTMYRTLQVEEVIGRITDWRMGETPIFSEDRALSVSYYIRQLSNGDIRHTYFNRGILGNNWGLNTVQVQSGRMLECTRKYSNGTSYCTLLGQIDALVNGIGSAICLIRSA